MPQPHHDRRQLSCLLHFRHRHRLATLLRPQLFFPVRAVERGVAVEPDVEPPPVGVGELDLARVGAVVENPGKRAGVRAALPGSGVTGSSSELALSSQNCAARSFDPGSWV